MSKVGHIGKKSQCNDELGCLAVRKLMKPTWPLPLRNRTYENQHREAKKVLVHNFLSFYPSSVILLLLGMWQ